MKKASWHKRYWTGEPQKDAGVQPGDIITQLNGHQITDVNDLVQTARTFRSGDSIIIHFQRGSESLTKQVTVKPRPLESAPDVNTIYQTVTAGWQSTACSYHLAENSGQTPGDSLCYRDRMFSLRKAQTFRVQTPNCSTA